jgi:SAM-dependent methyltransferase
MRREDWDARYAAVENLWSEEPNRLLVAEVGGLEPGRALDLACGEGRNAIWLARLGWDVTGVDFSPVAIAKARARAERDAVDAEFVCSDLLEYTPVPGSFDLVLLLYVHLPRAELRVVLARAQDALADRGTILVLGHDRTNLTEGVGGPQDPSILYTPEQISDELQALEIEKATTVLREVEGEERNAIDALVRATKS